MTKADEITDHKYEVLVVGAGGLGAGVFDMASFRDATFATGGGASKSSPSSSPAACSIGVSG